MGGMAWSRLAGVESNRGESVGDEKKTFDTLISGRIHWRAYGDGGEIGDGFGEDGSE